MKNKSQVKKIGNRVILPLIIFAVGGLLLPIYAAPYIYSLLPINPYQSNQSAVSIKIQNRNLIPGEIFSLKSSHSSGSANISRFEYACQTDNDFHISYQSHSRNKQLPCGVTIRLPERQRHSFRVQANENRHQAQENISIIVTVQLGQKTATTTFSVMLKNQQGGKETSSRSDTKMKSLEL